jgi:hypothetical protein
MTGAALSTGNHLVNLLALVLVIMAFETEVLFVFEFKLVVPGLYMAGGAVVLNRRM